MFFSIIVPVYKVQDYIAKCLDTILEQSMDDYEVILINDGSPVNSGKICESYSKRYEKIKYFVKENGGLSDARNFGIEKASGRYIVFVDSDDWIQNNILPKIKDTIVNNDFPDVVITRITEVKEDKYIAKDNHFSPYNNSKISKDRAVDWNFVYSDDTSPAIKTIVSRKLIVDNRLRFLKGKLHEDLDWTSRLFISADTFTGFYPEWYYYRLGREGSITNTLRSKNFIDTIEIVRGLFDEYGESDDPNIKEFLAGAWFPSIRS